MIKYGFDLEAIKKKKEKLEHYLNSECVDDEQIDFLQKSLDVCSTILDNFDKSRHSYFYQEEDYSTNMDLINDMKNYIQNDDYNDEHIAVRNIICEKIDRLNFLKKKVINTYERLNLTDNECIQLVGDMIRKKLGMSHYNVYKSMFIHNPTHVEFSDVYDSFIYYDISPNESYVIVKNKQDITKASDLAHEAGHYFACASVNNFITPETSLDEVESIFYELLFIDFLIEENIVKSDGYKLLDELLEVAICEKAAILHAEYSYSIYRINSVKEFKAMANTYDLYNKTGMFSSKDLLNWINLNNEENAFTYIYSSLVALELFNQYKISRNKKNVISTYEKFINQVGKVPDFKLASYINKDYITFNNFSNLKNYKNLVFENIKRRSTN